MLYYLKTKVQYINIYIHHLSTKLVRNCYRNVFYTFLHSLHTLSFNEGINVNQ